MNIQNASENFTVLVIDDDNIVIDMMQILFEDECQVISANNAADGIETRPGDQPRFDPPGCSHARNGRL